MHYEHICKSIGLTLNAAQHRVFRYLERRGLRFCVDFGTDNAMAIAREQRQRLHLSGVR